MTIYKKHKEFKLAYYSKNSISSHRKDVLSINPTRRKIEVKTVGLFFSFLFKSFFLNCIIAVPDLLTFNKPLCIQMYTKNIFPKKVCLSMYVCIEVSVHLYMVVHVGKFIYVSLFIHPYLYKYLYSLLKVDNMSLVKEC